MRGRHIPSHAAATGLQRTSMHDNMALIGLARTPSASPPMQTRQYPSEGHIQSGIITPHSPITRGTGAALEPKSAKSHPLQFVGEWTKTNRTGNSVVCLILLNANPRVTGGKPVVNIEVIPTYRLGEADDGPIAALSSSLFFGKTKPVKDQLQRISNHAAAAGSLLLPSPGRWKLWRYLSVRDWQFDHESQLSGIRISYLALHVSEPVDVTGFGSLAIILQNPGNKDANGVDKMSLRVVPAKYLKGRSSAILGFRGYQMARLTDHLFKQLHDQLPQAIQEDARQHPPLKAGQWRLWHTIHQWKYRLEFKGSKHNEIISYMKLPRRIV